MSAALGSGSKWLIHCKYYLSLSVLAAFFVLVVVPICSCVALTYAVINRMRMYLCGAPPDRYIEEANLAKSKISPLQQFMVLNRTPLVLAFALPLGRFFQIYGHMRTAYVHALNSAPEAHGQRLKHIQEQLQEWKKEGGTRKIVTARAGWQRVSNKLSTYKENKFKLHVGTMIDILKVDTQQRFVHVEPMVTMGQLVPFLMKQGYTLPVVPELEELTVGGMIAGTGVESSSHHSGLFQEFCIELEVALASGGIVTCSRSQRPELFEAFFWSYGTLGMLMSAKLRIIASAKYVRLQYHGFDSEQAFTEFFQKESENGLKLVDAVVGNDHALNNGGSDSSCARFVEGLVYSKDKAVVTTGEFVDKVGEDGVEYQHGKWYQQYFYVHARDNCEIAIKRGAPVVEYIPLRDYYYRHSRSVFWEIENIIPLGDSFLFRWGFGWMLPPSVAFLKLTTPKSLNEFYETKHVIQDMLVPVSALKEGLSSFRTHFDMYPLWVCPFYLRPGRGLVHANSDSPEMFVDLGAYGVPGAVKRGEDYDVVGRTRAVEHFVTSAKGFEMLYAESFMTKTEFGKMFDRSLYDELRMSLGAEKAFPDIYDKIVEPARLRQLKEYLGDDFVE